MVSQKNYRIFAAVFLILVILLGAYFVWSRYFSPEAKRREEAAQNVEKFMKANADFEAAMRADTYGGKTPQETLDMFIDALKKGDIDLAAKYFELETNMNDKNYLTRKKWEDALKATEDAGRLEGVISTLEKAKPAGSSMEGLFGFEVKNETDNSVATDINLHLDKYSNVWKIESM